MHRLEKTVNISLEKKVSSVATSRVKNVQQFAYRKPVNIGSFFPDFVPQVCGTACNDGKCVCMCVCVGFSKCTTCVVSDDASVQKDLPSFCVAKDKQASIKF
uniref:Uncharacterized protein n=1 Tax=Nothobranchius furzeri TaxID=105023 RepID=A0A1A8B8L8_NOTFU